jgi:hypothetical protein
VVQVTVARLRIAIENLFSVSKTNDIDNYPSRHSHTTAPTLALNVMVGL